MSIEKIRNTALLITAVAGALGAFKSVDNRYAHAETVQAIEKRLTLAELDNLLRKALENLYFYRDQCRKYPNDEELRRRLEQAEEEVRELKKQKSELTNEN